MVITRGSVVKLEYELKVKGGDVLETSAKSGPVEYVQGDGKMLPALEKRLEGLEAGKTLEGEIPAAEALPVEALPSKQIPLAEFPTKDVEVRGLYEAHMPGGEAVRLYVVAVDDKHVTVKLLPPFAGKDLLFKVRVIMVEDPVTHARAVVVKKPPPVPMKGTDLEEVE